MKRLSHVYGDQDFPSRLSRCGGSEVLVKMDHNGDFTVVSCMFQDPDVPINGSRRSRWAISESFGLIPASPGALLGRWYDLWVRQSPV